MELSYSLHLGNDKNKSIKARQEAITTELVEINAGVEAMK